MADGTISIEVEFNEQEFRAALENMGETVNLNSEAMIKSVENLSGSFSLLPATIESVLSAVPGITGDMITGINNKNPEMAAAGTAFFKSLIANMPNITEKIVNSAGQISGLTVKKFGEFSSDMKSMGNSLFMSLISNMPKITEKITDAVPQIAEPAVNKFSDFIPNMKNAGYNLFTSLISKKSDITEKITGEIPKITDKIIKTVADGNPQMADAGFDLFTSITGKLTKAIKNIAKAPGEIVNALVEKFNGFMEKFYSIGVNIVQGVWEGISSTGSWLADNVTGFFGGIINSVTDFLGISSPSKVFRDLVGRNIALGVKAGIDGEMPSVITDATEQMSRLAEASAKSARFNPVAADIIGRSDIYGGTRLALSPAGVVSQNPGTSAVPEINVVLEPTGDIRGFFDYIKMGVKRSGYLNGEI